MSAPIATRALRRAYTTAARSIPRTRQLHLRNIRPTPATLVARQSQCFSTSSQMMAGMMPHTDVPTPPSGAEEERNVSSPTELDTEEYHARADEYMNEIHEKAEAMQEERNDVDVEYSAGVLSIGLPAGTYVINKQPPSKQIWLSSPESGPKRFDFVMQNEGMNQKEGGGHGDWIYLRDGSSLTELLKKELGMSLDLHGHEDEMKQSVDPIE